MVASFHSWYLPAEKALRVQKELRELLQNKPDLLMFDGQGIASHMGLWLERPTIGVAKSQLYGKHEEAGPRHGDHAHLIDRNCFDKSSICAGSGFVVSSTYPIPNRTR
jgi:deoxyinosine 3'endonuclease (endonuclease V)